MVRTAALLVALAGVSLFIGCGADDDDSSAGGTGGGFAAVGGTVSGTGGGVAPAGTGGVAGSSGAGAAGTAGSAGTAGGAGSAGSAGSMAMDFVPGSPTFKAIYQEVFVATGCSGGPYCHGSGNLTGGLDMTDRAMTYKLLVGVDAASMVLPPMAMMGLKSCKDGGMKRVVAGQPDMSLLMEKISKMTPSCGTMMPPTGMIDAAKIEQVRMWIMMGAQDN